MRPFLRWVYSDLLHLPDVPWRRVIFDEIQDLVAEGTDDQKNLLQLTRTAQHVWLLSATPFPHGNASVYANHELLGFKRLKLDVETSEALDAEHPFEIIKRHLYIRSPGAVALAAVAASARVQHLTVPVAQSELERQFYHIELQAALEELGQPHARPSFGRAFEPLREMTVHPEASETLRSQASNSNGDAAAIGGSSSLGAFARASLGHGRARLAALSEEVPRAEHAMRVTQQSAEFGVKLEQWVEEQRAGAGLQTGLWGNAGPHAPCTIDRLVHDHVCGAAGACSYWDPHRGCMCNDGRKSSIRLIVGADGGSEFAKGLDSIIRVARRLADDRDELRKYIQVQSQTAISKRKTHEDLVAEQRRLRFRVSQLQTAGPPNPFASTRSAAASAANADEEIDELAWAHGSKCAALVRYLRGLDGEKAIIFSMWHDTLRLVARTLGKCGLMCVLCDGRAEQMSDALEGFTNGDTAVLLLSARVAASGANLQVASHVILLDPAGHTAAHGAALERQAVGRAVRMGQDKAVRVVRFVVDDTLEPKLIADIDAAALGAATKANDPAYTIEGAELALPGLALAAPVEAAAPMAVEAVAPEEVPVAVPAVAPAAGDPPIVEASGGVDDGATEVPPGLSAAAVTEASKDSGNAAYKQGDVPAAINDFTRGLAADPSNHILYSNRSFMLLELGKPDEALADADACVQLCADWFKGFWRRGAALVRLGRLVEAKASFCRTLELDPSCHAAREHIEYIEAKLNATATAETHRSVTEAPPIEAAPAATVEMAEAATVEMAEAAEAMQAEASPKQGMATEELDSDEEIVDVEEDDEEDDEEIIVASLARAQQPTPSLSTQNAAAATPSTVGLARAHSDESVASTVKHEQTPGREMLRGMLAVRGLLERACLDRYADAFEDAGYDDLPHLVSLASNETALDALSAHVHFKPGHAVRFNDYLAKEALHVP